MSTMTLPGFTADSALARAGRRNRPARVNVLADATRAFVRMARVTSSGPGGMQCELDAVLEVEEAGGMSTTNIWKCTTTVEVGGGGNPTPMESGEGGGPGGGSGSGGTPKPTPKPRPTYDPTDGGRCNARISGMTINNGTYRYDTVGNDFHCCGPRITRPNGEFVRQDCVVCQDDVRRCQNA